MAPARPPRPRADSSRERATTAGTSSGSRRVFAQLDQLDPRPMVFALARERAHRLLPRGRRPRQRGHGRNAGADLDLAYRAGTSSGKPFDVTLGFYEIWNNKLYNSAMYVTLGDGDPRIRHVHRKVFLPTYGLFDEERFVERGRDVRAFDTPWGRAAMLVCEDAWHSMTATIAALDGAQIIFVCAAPPARGPWPKSDDVPGPASMSRWDRLIREIADEHGVFVALTSLVGSEGGKVFPGGSFVSRGPRATSRAERRCGKTRFYPSASIWQTSHARAPTCRSSPISKPCCRICEQASTTSWTAHHPRSSSTRAADGRQGSRSRSRRSTRSHAGQRDLCR